MARSMLMHYYSGWLMDLAKWRPMRSTRAIATLKERHLRSHLTKETHWLKARSNSTHSRSDSYSHLEIVKGKLTKMEIDSETAKHSGWYYYSEKSRRSGTATTTRYCLETHLTRARR